MATGVVPSVIDLLSSTGLFNVLDGPTLAQVEHELVRERVHGGATLFNQGDEGDSLYVLIHGRLSVSVMTDDGRERVVAEIGRGEVVGEMAVLTGDPRFAIPSS
jgi:CRP-like cAMP-binding protein